MAEPGPGVLLETAVVTSDTLVYTGAVDVYWIAVGASGTGGKWELNNSTDGSGTDRFAGHVEATTSTYTLEIPTPIHLDTGLWVDIDAGGGIIIVVGYAIL